MGCDIHCFAERKNQDGKYEYVQVVFGDIRSYGLFGFLANVRNYSQVPPISKPRGLPDDVSASVKSASDDFDCDGHTHSWLSVNELLNFNYDAEMEDRRDTKQTSPNSFEGGATCEVGQGKIMTYREFLGSYYFEELKLLEEIKADRIVFWFDN